MVRGPKRHLKRLNAPSRWMMDKLSGRWAPKTSAGPHKMGESMPIIVLLRQRLKYALNRQDAMAICMNKLVQIDNKVRTDHRFPAGFMDVVKMEKSGDVFRMLYNTKGRFVLHRFKNADEANFKLCRITKRATSNKGIPFIVTHDGRTFRYPDPVIAVGDSVKLDLVNNKIVGHIPFDVGSLVMVTSGRNTGRVGHLLHRDRHLGSFDIVHIKDAAGHQFATRLNNVFVIGKEKSWVELPRGGGVKKSILE